MRFIWIFLFFLLNISATGQPVQVKVISEDQYQTIHNFGASDAWSCQYVGNWPEAQKNGIADLLFSLEMNEDGSPAGIGLSCWRFNIGGGSADQEGDTKIGDPWRRAECFLQKDGTYNWQKQKGQRWFLQAARERGVDCFLGFVNSPPVWLTKNGRANSNRGNSMNLTKENLPVYCQFLVEVIRNIYAKEGVLFDYISPVNEPQWDWKGGQEGSPWRNNELAELCRILGSDLKKAELSTKISISEAGLLTHLFERGNDSKRGFQVEQFFSQGSANYIGDVPNMAHKISGHSYHTVKSDSVMNLVRSKLHSKIEETDPSLEFWMSEYCILGGNGVLRGGGRDLGMETALFVAGIIHSDLTVAHASAWQWWLAVSPYDYKDGLVYIDKSETGGNFSDSKLLWTLGNYSRFIRPEAKRIGIEIDLSTNLKISAYQNKDNSVVVVIVNRENNAKELKLSGFQGVAQIFETSERHNLKLVGKGNSGETFVFPGRSVSTVVVGW